MTSVPLTWRLRDSRYVLAGSNCTDCNAVAFPPRKVCMECHSTNTNRAQFSGFGVVESFTTIQTGPDGFQGPYTIILAKLEEGPVVSGAYVGLTGPRVGLAVRMVFRRLSVDSGDGLIVYGFKFEDM